MTFGIAAMKEIVLIVVAPGLMIYRECRAKTP